jgi:hypothetical protein
MDLLEQERTRCCRLLQGSIVTGLGGNLIGVFALPFLLWLGYGLWLWRPISQKRGWIYTTVEAMSPNKKRVIAPLMLVGGVVPMMLGFGYVYSEKMLSKPMPQYALGMAILALCGMAFIHMQVLASAMMISIVVTPSGAPSSEE